MISARTNELENCLKESVSPGKSVHGEIDFLLTSKYPLGNGEAASSLFDSATASHFQINGEDSPQVSISATDTHLESEPLHPDSDSMKMFVGQIPKCWTEFECRQLLEPYGQIYALNILKDKDSKKSKGCCFVTYYTRKAALDAQNDLHNLRKLPSCGNPIQMKPADNENKNDRKLFVGKLSKSMKEADVSGIFSSFGIVEECVVLRDNSGLSKGCAFVTFSTRSSASSAIRALHQGKTFEGCSSPMVVKFAEASKEQKRQHNGGTVSPVMHSLCPPPSALQSCFTGAPLLDTSYLNLLKAQQQQQFMSLALPPQYLTPEAAYSAANSILFSGNKLPLLSNQILNSASHASKLLTSEALSFASLPTFATLPHSYSALPSMTKLSSPVANSKQREGPENANLFIYHLPAEYTDVDLVSLFSTFGSVISAKVFIDKNSNLSKCFGFVSFDNAESAQTAIRSMNGFQVLNKRLKVQLKKVRDRPY